MVTINVIKPIPSEQINPSEMNEKLSSAEQGKLWATYIGNTMSICVSGYMLKNVEDQDIKNLLQDAFDQR